MNTDIRQLFELIETATTTSEAARPIFRIGKIASTYVSGLPTVVLDGETTATQRTIPHLASYTPAANDRVLLASVGHGFVILGKVVT